MAKWDERAAKLTLVLEHGPLPLKQICALKAFFKMKLADLTKLAEELGVALPPDAKGNLVKTLFYIIQHVLQTSNEETMDIIAQRCTDQDRSAIWAAQLLEMDEVLDVLDFYDYRKVQEEQKDCISRLETCEVFEKEFVRFRRQMEQEKEAGAKKKAKKAVAAAPKPIWPNLINQSEAKKYLPPACSIWRGRTKRTWNCHCPGRSRISEPWATDEEAALSRILRRIWQIYCDHNGKTLGETCPWRFEEVACAAAAASSAG